MISRPRAQDPEPCDRRLALYFLRRIERVNELTQLRR
jgi:hypothetical protein